MAQPLSGDACAYAELAASNTKATVAGSVLVEAPYRVIGSTLPTTSCNVLLRTARRGV